MMTVALCSASELVCVDLIAEPTSKFVCPRCPVEEKDIIC